MSSYWSIELSMGATPENTSRHPRKLVAGIHPNETKMDSR